MDGVILREQIHGALLHRAVAGDHASVIFVLGNQGVRLDKGAGVQQLHHPLTGSQLTGGTLLGDTVCVSLQDGLLLGQHLLEVLHTHVQISLQL